MAWMGLGSIIAIIGIVIVAGSIIAVIGKVLLNTFDTERVSKTNRNADIIDYQQYKELESGKTQTNEYDFEQINMAKAKHEQELLEANKEDVDFVKDDVDGDLEEIENRLKNQELDAKEEEMIEIDDIDVMSLVDEISDDVVEEQKEIANEQVSTEMDSTLANMNIDDYLNKNDEETEEAIEETESIEDDIVDEILSEVSEEIEEVNDEVAEEISEEPVEEIADEIIDEEASEEVVEAVEEVVDNSTNLELLKANEQIEILKAQLQEVNSKLEEARNTRPAVTIDMTEEECLARLAILEDRLKNVKKDYKINQKEYKPLKKIMKDYERYQTKLRRKDAVVAKKKVDLYGVNNYVDIDKEKAEKLANELELLDGLRLSVSHCEEVINANKERFPILEHTNKILEEQIANIESDIEVTNITLQRIREKNGNGSANSDSSNGENQE